MLLDVFVFVVNYVLFVIIGNMVYILGQISQNDVGFIIGKLGDGLLVEQGVEVVKICVISLLVQVKVVFGGDFGWIE